MPDIACGIQVRAGNSHDRNIAIDVIERNIYRLPSSFCNGDVILDVGAHVGSFSYAALVRGAGKVHVFEPDRENFQLCRANLRQFGDKVALYEAAMWRSDIEEEKLTYTGPSETPEGTNYGGGNVVFGDGRKIGVVTESLESILSNIRHVRLLKLDCETSEWPVLFTCRSFECVEEIVGQYHEIGGPYSQATIPGRAQVRASQCYTADCLISFLSRHGFAVEATRWAQSNLGFFFAKRR